MNEIEFSIQLLNKVWIFRGLDSLRDLVEFLDKHCSEERSEGSFYGIDPPPQTQMSASTPAEMS